MSRTDVTSLDRALAKMCEICPVCLHARHYQQGVVYNFVKNVEQTSAPSARRTNGSTAEKYTKKERKHISR